MERKRTYNDKQKQAYKECNSIRSSSVNMYSNRHYEDGQYTKEEYAVNENGDPTGSHVAELNHPGPRRELKQEPR